MSTKSNAGQAGWAVWQRFEMFGDPIPERFDTQELAEAEAYRLAEIIAQSKYPSGFVEYCDKGGECGGSTQEIEWAEDLSELAGATEDRLGHLPPEVIARRIRASAIEVAFGFGTANEIMVNPNAPKYPTDCNGMTAVSVEAYKYSFNFGRSLVNWVSYLERSDRDTGAIRASDLFGDDELVRLGCPADETVYLHEVL